MSHKVYFRTQNSRAIVVQITNKIKYSKAIQMINKKFNIDTDNIKIVYNGEEKEDDFQLIKNLPHHVVHVVDRGMKKLAPFKAQVTVNHPKKEIENIDLEAHPKITIKQFVLNILRERGMPQAKADIYYLGKKLPQDSTFQEHQIAHDTNFHLVVKNQIDPSDIPAVSTALSATVNPKVLQILNTPKFSQNQSIIKELISHNFFSQAWFNKYEHLRNQIHYNIWGPYAISENRN